MRGIVVRKVQVGGRMRDPAVARDKKTAKFIVRSIPMSVVFGVKKTVITRMNVSKVNRVSLNPRRRVLEVVWVKLSVTLIAKIILTNAVFGEKSRVITKTSVTKIRLMIAHLKRAQGRVVVSQKKNAKPTVERIQWNAASGRRLKVKMLTVQKERIGQGRVSLWRGQEVVPVTRSVPAIARPILRSVVSGKSSTESRRWIVQSMTERIMFLRRVPSV